MQTIPLSEIAAYPASLTTNGTENNGAAGRELRSLERFTPEHREALVNALTADLRKWNAPESALQSVERFRSANSYAIVTGQQAGIATGPLYTLDKAIGVLRRAKQMEAEHPGCQFVPLFWIEGDDHDFDEARAVGVIDRTGNFATLRYDDGDHRPLHVGDRPVNSEGVNAVIAEMRAALIETEFSDVACTLLQESYMQGTLADGFARVLYLMLGDTPLVVLSSRNPQLKGLATDVFEAELRNPSQLFDAVTGETARLQKEGADTPISPKKGALFITWEGERRALDLTDDGYEVRGTGRKMTADEAIAMATEHPEQFSPNVALRPLVQDAILPTALYMGGPSEVSYLRQLCEAHKGFGLGDVGIETRPFVMLMEPKAKRALELAGLALEQVIAPGFEPGQFLMDSDKEKEIESARLAALLQIEGVADILLPITKMIDPTLEKSLGATTTNAAKGIEDYTKRLTSALKKKNQTEIDRLESARALLLPGGSLQERAINPLYYINKFGLERFKAALEKIEAIKGTLQIIEI